MPKVLEVLGQADTTWAVTTANQTSYFQCGATGALEDPKTTEAQRSILQKNAGTFSDLSISVVTNGIAASNTFTFRNNATDGNMVISVPSSSTGNFKETTPNSDTIVADDLTALKFVPGASTGTCALTSVSACFLNTSSSDTISRLALSDSTYNISGTSATFYECIAGENSSTTSNVEANSKCRIRKPGTYQNAGIYIRNNARTGGSTTTFTLRKNGADTALLISVTDGAATGWYEHTADPISVVAGDDVCWEITTGTGSGNIAYSVLCVDFVTTDGWFPLVTANTDAPTQADAVLTGYRTVSGFAGPGTANTESQVDVRAGGTFQFAELTANVTANDVAAVSTVTLMVNAVASALVASTAASTPAVINDSTHTVTVASTDLIDYKVAVPSVSGAHSILIRSILMWGKEVGRFYFHAANSTVTGTLPTSEQSTARSSAKDVDAQTVNRSMDANIGTSQTSITLSSLANTSTNNYYFTKFVSGPLAAQTIAANTWNYAFAANEAAIANNFPVGAANTAIPITCYVWRPSTGARIGYVLDGNSAAVYAECSAGTTEKSMYGQFTGSAVTISDGDVLVFEVWFTTTQATGTASNDIFYFDGTTPNIVMNTTVSSIASFIESPQVLAPYVVPALTRVLQSDTLVYHLIGRVLQSDTLKYNVRKQVLQSDTILYNVRKQVKHSNTLKYNIIGRIIHSNTLRYSLIGRIVHSQSLKYNIWKQILHANTLRYNVWKQVKKADTLLYNVRKQVTKQNTLLYNVLSGALSRILHANTLIYNVRLQVKHSNSLRYNLLKQILHNQTLKYNLIGRIKHALTVKYNLLLFVRSLISYDDFEAGTYSFTQGGTSPNSKWTNSYLGGVGATSGVRFSASAGSNVMWEKPQASTSAGESHSTLNLSAADWYNFDLTFRQRTVSQLRTGSTPNAWEVAWLIFRYTDDWHHYYLLIKSSGVELGRKDYFPHVEQQMFLATPSTPTISIGNWDTIRIKAIGNHFTIWINGAQVIDMADDGTVGFDSNTGGLPPAPTAAMYHGKLGPYTEDAEVEFDSFATTPTIKYNLLKQVTKANTLLWNLIATLARITNARTLKYNLIQRQIHTNTLKYNLAQQIKHSNTLRYNLLKQILHANTIRYNIIGRIIHSNTLKYNLLKQIKHSNSLRYSLIGRILHSQTLKYNLLKQTLHSNTIRYNLIGRVLHSQTLKYNLLKQALHSNTLKYNLRKQILHSNTLIYNLRKQVLHSQTLKYNLLKQILHSNILKYNLLGRIVHANTLRYNLLGRIVNANTLVYNILSLVRHIELTITEANIKLSDTFYKSRTITEDNINLGDSVNAEKTDNTPVNTTKTINESNIALGSGTLSRIVGKIRQLTDNINLGSDSASITRRNKVRTLTDTINMGDSLSLEKSQRHIEKSLSGDNINLGDSVSRQTNKSRRIGGPD